MKSITKLLFLGLMSLTAAIPEAKAQTFVWGGSVTFTDSQQKYYDSFGKPLLTDNSPSAQVFSVGYFKGGFTPTLANIDQWWTNFVELASDTLDSEIPWAFGGDGYLQSVESDELHPWLFGYDALGKSGSVGGQVFLGTWQNKTFPHWRSIDFAPTFDFSNMTDVIAGAFDRTFSQQFVGSVFTATGTIDGTRQLVIDKLMPDNILEAQLGRIAVVPEPSGGLLAALAAPLFCMRRRRSQPISS